jgi:hypothetical protein
MIRRIVWALSIVIGCGAFADDDLRVWAQTASVQQLFESTGLIGTFSANCSEPASVRNLYFVNRVIDEGHVQHDQMVGPADRSFAMIIDKAASSKSNEISIGGTIDTQQLTSVLRYESGRMRMMESTRVTTPLGRPLVDVEKVIVDGRFNNGVETPWLDKCDAR